ncbi:MAG: excinuclease ABC subunit C [Candidatus Cloacimonas sp. SDB]|nr:MAG: excinuclease ABC subunit C [Candidatus Cloacimonas sp. SDB]
MEKDQEIKSKLTLLPEKPGVYIMKNSAGAIIYIGKAKVLKNRVRSYFTGTSLDGKTRELMGRIKDFDYIITNNEEEALILESNLVKKHRPKYNIMLKDDKKYPFIKITLNEPFPRIIISRDLIRDGSKYVGPFTDSKAMRKTLRLLEWIFPVRTCKRDIPAAEIIYQKACINFQLGKCPAPCIGKITQNDYNKTIKQIIYFLNGRNQFIIDDLTAEMKLKSREQKFEAAARIRDKIQDIQKLNRSRTTYFTDDRNRDVIGISKEENKAGVAVLKMFSGKLMNKEIYALKNVEDQSIPAILAAFLKQYYTGKRNDLPFKILLPQKPEDFEVINDFLNRKLLIPQRGDLHSLVTLANKNAFNFVEEDKLRHLRKSVRTVLPVKELKDKIKLKKLPRKMICLDISTIQGSDTVSSVVYFENGKPKKKNYRRYVIKTVTGQDDFAAMAETLERYLKSVTEDDKPDLIVIDGGKGQLSSAFKILEKYSDRNIEIIALAKRLEEIFLPGKKDPITLPRSSSALRLLIAIRDEAHRFAVTFHRKRRSSRTLKSRLDEIAGIGFKTKFLLLNEFGSVENIRKQSIQSLTRIKGIGPKAAEKILVQLSRDNY